MLSRLRRLDAGGEELDEFGAVIAKGGEGLVGFNKFGVAQEFKPVLRLCGFLESDLKLGDEVRLALRIATFGDVCANGSAGAQHLLCDDGFLSLAQMFV